MKTNRSAEDVKHAYAMLRKFLPEGSTVYCVLRGISRSGMSRNIDFYAIVPDHVDATRDKPRPQWLTGYMACIGVVNQSRTDWEKSRGAKVHGCGMDMGFHVVDTLAAALYGREKNGIGAGLKHEWL